jgi:hypothetical protein
MPVFTPPPTTPTSAAAPLKSKFLSVKFLSVGVIPRKERKRGRKEKEIKRGNKKGSEYQDKSLINLSAC